MFLSCFSVLFHKYLKINIQKFYRRTACFILIGCFCSLSLYSQKFIPVNNQADFKKLYAGKSSMIATLKCDFEQHKKISMMENELVSKGKFVYKKNNKLRMEYTKPFKYIFILNNDKIFIKTEQKESSYSTKSNKLYNMISKLTMDCVTGDVINSKDFDVSVSENANMFRFNLKPRLRAIGSLISEIDVLINKNDFTVDRLDMKEESGDNTLLIFSNKRINQGIADEEFNIK
jgi:outer membrane lipoprotein-sorting protein